jgi:lipoprotein NlpI
MRAMIFASRSFIAVCLLIACLHARAETADDLLKQSHAAFKAGKKDEAIEFASKAIALDTKVPVGYYFRARLYSAMHQPEKALADFDHVVKLEPREAKVYQLRGYENFRLGRITECIADFDKFIAANPDQEPHHWQRGLAYYYAGRFEDGKKQFETHQTVNSEDVENAVWHFLCTARAHGIEKARTLLIPIKGDGRVPMKQVHALFKGDAKPEDVLAAAKAGDPAPEVLKKHQFYAYLYLGLYYEALGDTKLRDEYIFKAAEGYDKDDYMVDTAKVHASQLKKQKKTD